MGQLDGIEISGKQFFLDADSVFHQDGYRYSRSWIEEGDVISSTDVHYGDIDVRVKRTFERPGRLTVEPGWSNVGPMAEVFRATVYDGSSEHPEEPVYTGSVSNRAGILPLPFFMERAARLVGKAEKMAGSLAVEAG